MKKALLLFLALTLCLSLCACSGKTEPTEPTEEVIDLDQEAFDRSQKAFELITETYISVNNFSGDIYEAWYLGVNDKKSYDQDSEFEDFADEMDIDQKYIEQAVASLLDEPSFSYGDWSLLPYLYSGSYFSAWVSVISEAYVCSGDVEKMRDNLTEAKNLMKELSSDFSDYEHYPALKEYFTNTLAFLDFCCNPEGSFEQVVETFNSYRNAAREHFFDLNYIFGDSINGFEDYEEPEETADSL